MSLAEEWECCWSSDVRASRCSSTQGAQEFLYILFQLCIQTLTVALALHILCDSWLNSVQIIRKGTWLVNLLYYHELIIIAEPKNLGSLWIYIQKQQLLISINSISRGSRIWLAWNVSRLLVPQPKPKPKPWGLVWGTRRRLTFQARIWLPYVLSPFQDSQTLPFRMFFSYFFFGW